jgi:hypothetical protein
LKGKDLQKWYREKTIFCLLHDFFITKNIFLAQKRRKSVGIYLFHDNHWSSIDG